MGTFSMVHRWSVHCYAYVGACILCTHVSTVAMHTCHAKLIGFCTFAVYVIVVCRPEYIVRCPCCNALSYLALCSCVGRCEGSCFNTPARETNACSPRGMQLWNQCFEPVPGVYKRLCISHSTFPYCKRRPLYTARCCTGAQRAQYHKHTVSVQRNKFVFWFPCTVWRKMKWPVCTPSCVARWVLRNQSSATASSHGNTSILCPQSFAHGLVFEN